MNNHPKTRAEAKAVGAKHYFTGRPCKHNHIALRETKGVCVECRKIEQKRSAAKRKQRPKSEAAKQSGRRYYEKNREVVKAKAAMQPPEKRREYRRKWKQQNPDVVRAHIAQKKSRLRIATPKALSKEHRRQNREFYVAAAALSRSTGVTYSVDHAVPLAGKNICGLHVPWNLQIIPLEDNCKKGISWDEE